MDGEQPNIKQLEHDLESATVTPIAELGSHLTDLTKRSIRGVITIVWPYSTVTKSLSFVLAEPDFRLRRQKGQVRVIFVGQCAKTIADAALGGGDEVLLSLDGVEWVEGDAPGIAGATLECHARFTSGALLRARNAHGEQFKDPRVIYVDPAANGSNTVELPPPTLDLPPVDKTPDPPATPEPILTTKRRRQEGLDPEEYASPAFIKRARVSYGSLFEGAFDFFDDDVESSGRNRRRSKFGRDSSAWRYTSQSRSPEPETIQTETTPSRRILEEVPSDVPRSEPDAIQVEEEPSEHALKEVPSNEPRPLEHPPMVDEGCQTSGLSPSPPTPSPPQREEGTVVHETDATLIAVPHVNGDVSSPIHPHHAAVDQHPDYDTISFQAIPGGVHNADVHQPELFHTQHAAFTNFQEQRLHPSSEPGIHHPFGGFSSNPIPWGSSVPYPTMHPSHEPPSASFTSHHDPSPYPDLPPSFAAPLQQHALPGLQLPGIAGEGISEPHVERQRSETHVVSSDVESAQGDMPDGEPIAEAEVQDQPLRLEENIRTLLPEQYAADRTAEYFADVREPPGPEMTSRADEEMDVEEAEAFPSDDEDEGGDYDTQNYADTQDDDEGVFDEEGSENYDETDEGVYDEDGRNYGLEGEYEEDEEHEDEDEEQDENGGWEGPTQATAPPTSSAPVFIDLISDSEDEDVQGQDAKREGHEEEGGKQAVGIQERVNTAEEAEEEVSDEHHGEEEGGKEVVDIQERMDTTEEAEEEVSDEHHEEEEYNDEEDEHEERSQEDLEDGEEEGEGNSAMQLRGPTPSSSHHGEADSEAHHAPVAADVDQDEAAGAEDVDMAASTPNFVAPLSSPPPEAITSPVTAPPAEPPDLTGPAVTVPGADSKQENATPETPEFDPATVADGVQPVADQAAEKNPSQTPVASVEAEEETFTEPSAKEADVEEDAQISVTTPDRYASQPVASPVQHAEGSAPPEPISSMEVEGRGLVGSTQEADAEEDTHMSDASPDRHALQPATPPVRYAQDNPLQESISPAKAEERGLQEQSTLEADEDEDTQMAIASSAQQILPPATSPVQHARVSPLPEPTSPVETEERGLKEQSKLEADEDEDAQMAIASSAQPILPPATSPVQHARGSPLPEPTSTVETEERGLQEQEAEAEEDTQMGIVSPIRYTSQPATSPVQHAREPIQADVEDDEMDVEMPIPVREALDEQVQADIERQVLEDSSFIGHDDAEAVANTGQLDEASSRLQSPAEDAVEEEIQSDLPTRAEGPASPPLTQPAQSLEPEVTEVDEREEIPVVPERPEPDHLLTPDATQLTSTVQSFEVAVTMELSGGSSEAASKVRRESPTFEPSPSGDIMTPVRARPNGLSPPTTESFPSQPVEEGTREADAGGAEGFAITVNSLRSKRHRRNLSLEKSEVSRRDPSTRMARASIAARDRNESARRDSSARRARRTPPAVAASDSTLSPRLTGRTTRSRARSSRMSSASPEPPQPKSPELGDAAAGRAAVAGGGDAERETKAQGILKIQLNKNLRLSLLDLTALKVLRNNVNKKVDVLGVATAQPPGPQRPRQGPRDYVLSLTATDQTTCPNGVVAVQVFRPHIESLPVVREGDVVLLRQFAVTALRGRGFGLRSCETSSWAVWEAGGSGGGGDDGLLPQIKGPPVEVAPEEAVQAGLLLRWYAGLGGRAREKLGRANARMEQQEG